MRNVHQTGFHKSNQKFHLGTFIRHC